MYLYFKAMSEAERAWKEYKKNNPDEYYTAEWVIGYILTRHPLFLIEIILEAIIIVAVAVYLA